VLLPFVDRTAELERLRALFHTRGSSLACVYGRRRVGKSRLVTEALAKVPSVYYLADERDDHLQRRALAREIDRLVPGFARVEYPDWDALLDRWAESAPSGAVLAIDELPYLVAAAPELPSILQRRIDRQASGSHWLLCGSSQRMMHGIVLDAAAPLYGRATEILKIEPLAPPFLAQGLGLRRAEDIVASFATWGGIPRYWELARGKSLATAQRDLVLDPLGVLHDEPLRLLHDELRETMQAHSILSVIGQGCHRLSEIAGRIERPATSLARPIALLVDLGLIKRELPFGEHPRRSKRARYRIADPFVRYWYRFVDPYRSLLQAGQFDRALAASEWPAHLAEVWEEIVRDSIPQIDIDGTKWGPAQAWWGRTTAGDAELDVVAADPDNPRRLLVGEVKLTIAARDVARLQHQLEAKARACEWAHGKDLVVKLWSLRPSHSPVIDAREVLARWRESLERRTQSPKRPRPSRRAAR
jgi:uncharacterized protein